MPPKINAEDLLPETLEKLGIDLDDTGKPGKKPSKVTALGKVLQAIGRLSKDEATWTLTEAMSYVRKQGGQASDTTTVIRTVARYYGITPSEITGRRRTETAVDARQMVMYLLWLTSRYTLTQVGQAVGNRAPSTVSFAFAKISQQIAAGGIIVEHVAQITAELKLLGGDW